MQDKSKSPSLGKSGLLKPLQQNKFLIISFFIFLIAILAFVIKRFSPNLFTSPFVESKKTISIPTSTPSPTPSPTPKPLTFEEMSALYGPCVRVPVLMYHHVQSEESAVTNKQTSISVYTNYFEKQMQYLKDKNYNVISVTQLVDFFDNGTPIPSKSVLITFDDGYEDFYTDAFPILQKFSFPATVFIPTGLMNNTSYLSWEQISSMSNLILFANHTWSHKNVKTTTKDMEYEISTADTQLNEHSLNFPKVFAYPYGLDSTLAENYLDSLKYKLAFTTSSGSVLCKKQRFSLPRIRIGNTSLSSYGF